MVPDPLSTRIGTLGVPAAIVAATLQGIIHSQLLAGQNLPEIASLVNQLLCTRNVGKYATMVLLKMLPDGRVEYMNCGHIQPLSILDSQIRPGSKQSGRRTD